MSDSPSCFKTTYC